MTEQEQDVAKPSGTPVPEQEQGNQGKQESLFPLAVSGKYVQGGKTELVMNDGQLLFAVFRAIERSPIGVAIVGPATGHKDEPA